MYQTFIILFREFLEISIILSVVLAATKNIKGRNLHILYGIFAGIVGACLIALFTKQISSLIDGAGQEITNAAILLFAGFFIGWTVIWMRKHGKHLSQSIKSKSQAIHAGEASLLAITGIIALSIFREGSEIVLFTYSILITSTDTASQIILGGVLGIAAGAIVGLLFYLGILKFSGKYLFDITAILLSLIAASMIAQAGMFIQSAGYLSMFNAQPLWDTSKFISDSSVIGNVLNIVTGYTAKPTIIEIIFYIASLAVIWTLNRKRSS